MNDPMWHYSRDGQRQEGPVSASALVRMLEAGELPANTLVWREGLSEWKAADAASELAWKPPVTPPPLPGQRAPAQPPAEPRPPHAGTARREPALPRLEIVPKGRRNALLVAIGSTLFVAGGAWMLGAGETVAEQAVGLVALLFFGVGGIVAVPRMMRRRHSMVLDPGALEQVTIYGSATVPWSDVERIGVTRVMGQRWLGVRLKTYDRYLEGVSGELAANLQRGLPYLRLAAKAANAVPVPEIVELWSQLKTHDDPASALDAFGKVGDLAGMLHWTRTHFGFDVLFGWADFDRPPEQLVELMEQYRRAAP